MPTRPPVLNSVPAAAKVPQAWSKFGYRKPPTLASIPDAQPAALLNYARLAYDASVKQSKAAKTAALKQSWAGIAEMYAAAIDYVNALPNGWPPATQQPLLGAMIRPFVVAADLNTITVKAKGKPTAAAVKAATAPAQKPATLPASSTTPAVVPAQPPTTNARPPVINGATGTNQVPQAWSKLGYSKAPQLAQIPDVQVGPLLNYARLSYDASMKQAQSAATPALKQSWAGIAEMYASAIDYANAMPQPWQNTGLLGAAVRPFIVAANLNAVVVQGKGKPTAAAVKKAVAPAQKPATLPGQTPPASTTKTTATKPTATKKPVATKSTKPTKSKKPGATAEPTEVVSPDGVPSIPDTPPAGGGGGSSTGLIVAGVAGVAALGTVAYLATRKKKGRK